MTVLVKLSNGRVDEYMRFGDVYVRHGDGTLDVVRTGGAHRYSYAAGEWVGVDGDEKRWKKSLFWR
ncbi:hypothetical protein ACTWP6_29950 [Mycobacterium sp. 4D054]|uniref:hypothetical protein n=1 Tax=unclassified Mycobacterium TaxID=2642494 RepID=UPI0021B3A8F3|nr:hypothetical protein [Mycobacterium sp. SMC-8]UXA15277.1 hypothetical protein KXD97_12065 [Mycobacterium sp. SMC-8]